MSKKRIVGQTLTKPRFDSCRLWLLMYPVIRRRIQQTAYVFIYPPRSRNHPFLRYDELPEPGDGLSSSRVADLTVEESLQLRKEGEVPRAAMAAITKEGAAAVLEVEEFCFTGELVSE